MLGFSSEANFDGITTSVAEASYLCGMTRSTIAAVTRPAASETPKISFQLRAKNATMSANVISLVSSNPCGRMPLSPSVISSYPLPEPTLHDRNQRRSRSPLSP